MAEPVNGLLRRQPVLNGLLGPARMSPNLQAQGRNALASLRGTPSPFLDPEFYKRDLGPSAASYFSEPENALRALSVAPVPVLSDVAGLAADALMYKNKPESRNMLNFGLTGVGLLPFIPALATAYHGSPYKFDKFDAAHIGKGEGAQAYGHGVYFAESPNVAKSYRDALTPKRTGVDPFNFTHDGSQYTKTNGELFKNGMPVEKTNYSNAFISAQKKYEALPNGALYKVDIPDEYIPRMLDWDKPLSQQPHFRAQLAEAAKNAPDAFTRRFLEKAASDRADNFWQNGAEFYRQLTSVHAENMPRHVSVEAAENAAQATASEFLKSLGIPGIRYLDGGSRGTGQGTSNFVVFPGNEGSVKILERK